MLIKFQKMSESEEQVMNIIWCEKSPITSLRVIECLGENCQWKKTTVLTFLKRLCEKGLISVDSTNKVNQYHPVISKENYIRLETASFLKTVHQGSLKNFVMTLCGDEADLEINKEELEALKRWLNKE